MLSKKIIKNLFILLFLLSFSSAQAQEKIVGFEEKDLAALNEELRGLGLEAQITAEGRLDVHSKKITNVATPTTSTDGANMGYVDGKFPVTAASQVNTSALYGTTYLPDATVDTTALKTATGEVSTGTSGASLTLPGGTYGFWPQIKSVPADTLTVSIAEGANIDTSYLTLISAGDIGGGCTFYAQQRYVTASGEDLWIFMLIDKTTKEIIAAYQAPDHPAYGNGGDFDKIPHPFGSYDETKHEIILLDKETCLVLKQESEQIGKSILTLVNEDYRVAYYLEYKYKPLHSGKFLGGKPELIQSIPNYIKVRSLYKMTDKEKKERENQRLITQAEIIANRQTKENKIKEKLNLTDSELRELREVLR